MVSISSKSKVFEFPVGGRNPHQGGLHLTCNPHFRTRMSYFSQKSCVKIWFGLVEIGGMLILRGEEAPYQQGIHVTYNVHLRTWPSYSSQNSYAKIWFGLVEPFNIYRVHKQTNIQTYKHPKKKSDATETNILRKFFFRADNK